MCHVLECQTASTAATCHLYFIWTWWQRNKCKL